MKGLVLLPCYTQGSLLRDRGTGACGIVDCIWIDGMAATFAVVGVSIADHV